MTNTEEQQPITNQPIPTIGIGSMNRMSGSAGDISLQAKNDALTTLLEEVYEFGRKTEARLSSLGDTLSEEEHAALHVFNRNKFVRGKVPEVVSAAK